jgi:hypothetical protein
MAKTLTETTVEILWEDLSGDKQDEILTAHGYDPDDMDDLEKEEVAEGIFPERIVHTLHVMGEARHG